ncbi:uncharacterized protein JCM15063_004180 [Sporobolomyces koalae]|uniref:uncharacterized protein n=1 Tax=Sporobolomyces koalae TaxID=500713 RepID=UPI00316B6813
MSRPPVENRTFGSFETALAKLAPDVQSGSSKSGIHDIRNLLSRRPNVVQQPGGHYYTLVRPFYKLVSLVITTRDAYWKFNKYEFAAKLPSGADLLSELRRIGDMRENEDHFLAHHVLTQTELFEHYLPRKAYALEKNLGLRAARIYGLGNGSSSFTRV